jgi:hypothetical protein
MATKDETFEHYQKSQSSPPRREMEPLDLENADPRFVEAVENYARSQGVDINSERVIKYARGLSGRTGDFGGREQESPVGRRK